VNTESTETNQGYVFYDANCPLCRGWIRRVFAILVRRGLHPVPFQAGWVRKRLQLSEGEPLVEMKLLTRDGKIHGGADALAQIARAIWWAWPLYILAQIPGVKSLLRRIYLRLAANRPCDDGLCPMPKKSAREHRHSISAFFELP
jgi:predicted DCC family thiol-disulfide oxidoreductase YuxK